MRRIAVPVLIAAALVSLADAAGAKGGRIEVIEISGIVDGSVERAVTAGIRDAASEGATLVLIEIDSRGVVGAGRARRLVSEIGRAGVPVATWVGPPGAHAENGSALLALSGRLRAMAPAARLGPLRTVDLRAARATAPATVRTLERSTGVDVGGALARPQGASQARSRHLIDAIEPSLSDVLAAFDGRPVRVRGRTTRLSSDPEIASIRLHKLDLLGRGLHAAAKPSISYLLLLLGLVGLVFELFHPSTGPAGVTGAASVALALYGVVVLGGSWLGVGLVVAGVVGFCVDLRFESLGVFTAAGFVALVAGSLLMYRGPWLRPSPWVLAFGIVAMVTFLLGAMTRVLRDLRAIARGELEVRDAHAHPEEEQGGDGAP